ncbi:tyrosine-type recombinase/integrase [Shewanella algae]|uniref:tyrosine-type recombinase/integrase n=1 Tax=Shewanella algae TaxID=38313 RepID=UPI0031F52949
MVAKRADPIRDKELCRQILRRVDSINPVIALQLELEALTGLRYCDSSRLRPSDVLINGVIRSHFDVVQQKVYNHLITKGATPAKAKARATMTVYVGEALRDVIDDVLNLQEGKQYLFESSDKTGKPYTAQWINKILKTVAMELRLNFQLSSHSFRKTFAMAMVGLDSKLTVTSKALGHARVSSTEHYLSTMDNDVANLVSQIKY